MANSVDPDQTAPLKGSKDQSDLGLHYLPGPIFTNTWGQYGNS